jgi:hypothetical protein
MINENHKHAIHLRFKKLQNIMNQNMIGIKELK